VAEFKKRIQKFRSSEDFLDAVEQIIRDRKLSPARAAKL
jgi:hypothetical protein